MAVSLVDHATGHATTNPQATIVNPIGANLLVAVIADFSGGPGYTFGDSKSNTWIQAGSTAVVTAGQMNLRMWYAWNAAVEANQVFSAIGSGIFGCICVAAFSGVKTSADPLKGNVGAVSNFGTSTSQPMIVSSDVTADQDLLVGGAGIPFGNGTMTWTVDGSFSITDQFHTSGVTEGAALAWELNPNLGAVDLGWTGSISNYNTAGLIAIFSPASGQFARPIADVSDGSWTPSTGVDLYATIDETTPSDADYDRSGSAPVADTAIVQLTSLSTPNSGTSTLRVRGKTT